MGHIHDFGRDLEHRLAEVCEEHGLEAVPDFRDVIKWVKGEILQSYRNGVEVGAKQGSGNSEKQAPRRFTKRSAK